MRFVGVLAPPRWVFTGGDRQLFRWTSVKSVWPSLSY
jgi:hypothetical protein